MKRTACVAAVALAWALGGCAVPTEPTGGASTTESPAAKSGAKPAPSTEAILRQPHTYWVAFANNWGARFGTGGGLAGYAFTFPTPWITWIGTTGQTYPIVDFDAFEYEHNELMPIQSAANTPAYVPYQWYVAQISIESCVPNGSAPSALSPGGTCVGSFIGGLRFLVPFTDTGSEGALETAEQSWLAQTSDVQAVYAPNPVIFVLRTDSGGNYLMGTASDSTQHYFLGSQVAQYPYADVHDPKQPPI